MKTVLVVAVLVVSLGLVTACGKSPPAAEPSPSYETLVEGGFADPAVPRITAEDLKHRLDRGEKMLLIDNRSEYKFKTGHLAGAINIAYAIESLIEGAEEAMDQQLAALPKDVLLVLYCD